MQPLDGYRMLDLSHMIAGPSASMMLADLGMEVIKIEPPGQGEVTRRIGDRAAFKGTLSPYYMTYNRNKKSLTLNLKTERGQAIFHDLITQSDVVLYNFSLGVIERLGLAHEVLSAVNPRLVTASVTGFGLTGPLREATSYDMIAQSMGGSMAITGEADNPLRAGIPIADVGGGYLAAMGIMAALIARQTTGKGQHVDASMLDSQISMLGYVLTTALIKGENPPRMGNAHPVHVPYDAYPTADGWISVACVADSFWLALMEVVDVPELNTEENRTQPGRDANREAITAKLTEAFKNKTTDAWLALLTAARVPCAPVLNIDEMAGHPQMGQRGMVVEIDHPEGGTFTTMGNAIKLSDVEHQPYTAPPLVGQHTDDVLTALLGYDAPTLTELREAGVI